MSVREGRRSATTKVVRDALSEEFAEVIANGLAEGNTGAVIGVCKVVPA